MSAEVTAILASSDARDARRLDARTSRRNGKTSAEVTAILPSQDASNARVLTTRLDRRTNGVNNMDPANGQISKHLKPSWQIQGSLTCPHVVIQRLTTMQHHWCL